MERTASMMDRKVVEDLSISLCLSESLLLSGELCVYLSISSVVVVVVVVVV